MGRKAELCLNNPHHVCGIKCYRSQSWRVRWEENLWCDHCWRSSGAEEWACLGPITISQQAPRGAGYRRGGRRAMIRWVEHGRTVPSASACCWRAAVIPTPFPSPCIPCVTQRAPHSSPEHEVAPIESPDTVKRHEGREFWHRRGQQAEVKGSVAPPPHPHPCLEGLCVLLLSSCTSAPILFQDCQSSGSQVVGSSSCQTWAVLPSTSNTERPFGEGFDEIKHSPFLKVLLAVCFCDDLQFSLWPLGIWHSSRGVTANTSVALWVSSMGIFPTTAAACALHEGVKWLTSKSHYAVATVITT